MRYLYSALFYCLLPLVLLRMLWRSRLAPAYRQRLAERLGWFAAPTDTRPVIWVHAVSVGETLAAAPLIEALLAQYPQHQLVVTTTTPTGSERVQALFGERVFHVYAPWDTPGAVRRFMARIRPSLLLIMETELWPNMLHYSTCPILLANARLSARSARGYQRVGRLTRGMLQNLHTVACQGEADGERFVELGLPRERLHCTGSIKFDMELPAAVREQALALRQGLGPRPVLVAASTHPGEDALILSAFSELRRSCDNCLLLLVPRHPERFDAVYQQCVAAGWQVVRRSAGTEPQPADDVLLGDTMGELVVLLGAATVAIIGGSLVEHGGHNVLEPAAWGVPVVTGPHMFNFADISALLVAGGAMWQLGESGELPQALIALFGDSERRQQMGAAGQRIVADNRGARGRLLELVAAALPQE
jgi:3-deoxy-D-manno-octulosonic-acid transferase